MRLLYLPAASHMMLSWIVGVCIALSACGGGGTTDGGTAATASSVRAAVTASASPVAIQTAAELDPPIPATASPAVDLPGDATLDTSALTTTTPTRTEPLERTSPTSAPNDAAATAHGEVATSPQPGVAITSPDANATPAVATLPATTAAIAGDAAQPTASVGKAAALTNLTTPDPSRSSTMLGLGVTSACNYGFAPPATLTAGAALPLPASATFYTAAELATWRYRLATGPYLTDGDQQAGSPGDWARIRTNASAMATSGEAALAAGSAAEQRDSHGILARDAAFVFLMTGDPAAGNAARRHLLAQAANPANDFASTLCIITLDGTTYDAWFHHAAWLLRHAVTYDFVRTSMNADERLAVENWLRRNAYFLAGHTDWGINNIFPNRGVGNYKVRRDAAAAMTEAEMWFSRRFDTNGDCQLSDADSASPMGAFTYIRGDGTAGPRISVLSQYFNNRKSTAVAAFGTIGVLLAEPALVTSAKRYFMEWLTYSVWPDGSQGEYIRNGDYCIAPQGVVYAWLNLQGAAVVTRVLARHGDLSLLEFNTRDGLFGSESGIGAAKSLAMVANTHLQLATGRLPWFAHEPWKPDQSPRPATALGSTSFHYLGNAMALDDYHELGLLPIAALLGNASLKAWITREKGTTALPFPGATGHAVATGLGVWSDAFNAMPAVLLLRP